MTQFGGYITDRLIYSGATGNVWSAARTDGGGKGKAARSEFVVRTFEPAAGLYSDEQIARRVDEFMHRVKTQERVVQAGGRHWAPILEIGRTGSTAWYATQRYARSAEVLVDGVDMNGAQLYHVIGGVVRGLIELRDHAGQAHGDLTPSRVLLENPHDCARGAVVLTGPEDARRLDSERAATEDLGAVGELIFGLVLHRRLTGPGQVPDTLTDEWRAIGPNGDKWRELCRRLLVPGVAGAIDLDTVRTEIDALYEKPSGGIPKWVMAVAVLAIVAGVVIGVFFPPGGGGGGGGGEDGGDRMVAIADVERARSLREVWHQNTDDRFFTSQFYTRSLDLGYRERWERYNATSLGRAVRKAFDEIADWPDSTDTLVAVAAEAQLADVALAAADATKIERLLGFRDHLQEIIENDPAVVFVRDQAAAFDDRGWAKATESLAKAISTLDEILDAVASEDDVPGERDFWNGLRETTEKARELEVVRAAWTELDVVRQEIAAASAGDPVLERYGDYLDARTVEADAGIDLKKADHLAEFAKALNGEAVLAVQLRDAAVKRNDARFAVAIFDERAYANPALAPGVSVLTEEQVKTWIGLVQDEQKFWRITGREDLREVAATQLKAARGFQNSITDAALQDQSYRDAVAALDGGERRLTELRVLDWCGVTEDEITQAARDLDQTFLTAGNTFRGIMEEGTADLNERFRRLIANPAGVNSKRLNDAWLATVNEVGPAPSDVGAAEAQLRSVRERLRAIETGLNAGFTEAQANDLRDATARSLADRVLGEYRETLIGTILDSSDRLPTDAAITTFQDTLQTQRDAIADAVLTHATIERRFAQTYGLDDAEVMQAVSRIDADTTGVAALAETERFPSVYVTRAQLQRIDADELDVSELAAVVESVQIGAHYAARYAAWRALGSDDKWLETANNFDVELQWQSDVDAMQTLRSMDDDARAASRAERWSAFALAATTADDLDHLYGHVLDSDPGVADPYLDDFDTRVSDAGLRANRALYLLWQAVGDRADDASIRAAIQACIDGEADPAVVAVISPLLEAEGIPAELQIDLASEGPATAGWQFLGGADKSLARYQRGGALLTFRLVGNANGDNPVYIATTELSVAAMAEQLNTSMGQSIAPLLTATGVQKGTAQRGFLTWAWNGTTLSSGPENGLEVHIPGVGSDPTRPMNGLSASDAIAIASSFGCRLPTVDELMEIAGLQNGTPNLREVSLGAPAAWEHRLTVRGSSGPGTSNDGDAWFRGTNASVSNFQDVTGNVWEYASQGGERSRSVAYGGSAFSDLHADERVRANNTYADAGMRLAFQVAGRLGPPPLWEQVASALNSQAARGYALATDG